MSAFDLSVIPVVKVRLTFEHDLKDRAVTSEHWTTWFFDIIESPAAKKNLHMLRFKGDNNTSISGTK